MGIFDFLRMLNLLINIPFFQHLVPTTTRLIKKWILTRPTLWSLEKATTWNRQQSCKGKSLASLWKPTLIVPCEIKVDAFITSFRWERDGGILVFPCQKTSGNIPHPSNYGCIPHYARSLTTRNALYVTVYLAAKIFFYMLWEEIKFGIMCPHSGYVWCLVIISLLTINY